MKKKIPDKRTLLIVTGGPGTGKSGTAARFLDYLDDDDLVKISYDQIKEKNWDIFGFENEAQKDRLNWWSLEEFYLTIQKKMWEQKTILIEYPFYQRHKTKLAELISESHYSAVTIYLHADSHIVYERAMHRDRTEIRHPGHFLQCYHKETYHPEMMAAEQEARPSYEKFISEIAQKEYNIGLGLVIPIDVTDFNQISYEEIYHKIVCFQEAEV